MERVEPRPSVWIQTMVAWLYRFIPPALPGLSGTMRDDLACAVFLILQFQQGIDGLIPTGVGGSLCHITTFDSIGFLPVIPCLEHSHICATRKVWIHLRGLEKANVIHVPRVNCQAGSIAEGVLRRQPSEPAMVPGEGDPLLTGAWETGWSWMPQRPSIIHPCGSKGRPAALVA